MALTAHEMQVPMSVLGWNLSRLERLLGEEAARPNLTRVLGRLREAQVRLTTLVEDLLNLAKLHQGAFRVFPRPVQVTEIIRRCLRSVEREAERRGVQVQWSWDPSAAPLTRGDPTRLTEVVTNLVSNGVKYTPRGGRVTVTVRPTSERAPSTMVLASGGDRVGKYLLIAVADTGIGIPVDEQSHVFEQFFRGRKAFASAEGGTGLGLYFVQRIVEDHGGAVWFTSREGYGSTFTFTLPVAEVTVPASPSV